MTVNISKQLLGMACIVAGAFIPLILCTLNLATHRVRSRWMQPSFIHLTTPLLLTVMAITVLVNVRESSEARGRGGTSLEQLPRNAATLLTGAVGMLAPLHLPGQSPSAPPAGFHPPLRLFVYAMTSTVLLMEAA